MPSALEQQKIKDLITETVKILCQSSLKFQSKFSIEGLLGITVDDKDVFLINIHEVMSSLEGEQRDIVSCLARDNSMSEDHVSAEFTPSRKTPSHKPRSVHRRRRTKLVPSLQHVSASDQLTGSQPREDLSQTPNYHSVPSGVKPVDDSQPQTDQLPTIAAIAGSSDIGRDMGSSGHDLQERRDTVKEEITSDASDCQLDYSSNDLVMECTSLWGEGQNMDMQESMFAVSRSGAEVSEVVSSDDQLPQYTLIPGGNGRGGPALVSSDGHRYGIKMVKPNVTYWRCVVRNKLYNCRAVVIQRGNTFIRGAHDHCHLPHGTVYDSVD